MSLRNFVRELRELKENLSHSTRSFPSPLAHSQLATWHVPNQSESSIEQTSAWAHLPAELLLDIVQRVEQSDVAWPERRHVVACAAVCRSWRSATKEAVKTLQESARFTFPVSLKQPGPREHPIQCFVRRERSTSTFRLYLGLSPSLHGENDKLLMAARKVRRATGTDFVISLASDDFSKNSNTYVGKLRFGRVINFSELKPTLLGTHKPRSNFLGTKFTIFDSLPPPPLPSPSSSSPYTRSTNTRSANTRSANTGSAYTRCAKNRIAPRQVSPRVPAGNHAIASIAYELNVLRTRGPRRMRCTMHHLPLSSLLTGSAPTPTDPVHEHQEEFAAPVKPKGAGTGGGPGVGGVIGDEPLVLRNKAPRWHEQLQCWCLNFRGRVTVASVKNFQLVAAPGAVDQREGNEEREGNNIIPPAELEKVILQFGKIGKDIFTMDFRYPLSAFQAFAICLTSFDTKPACE